MRTTALAAVLCVLAAAEATAASLSAVVFNNGMTGAIYLDGGPENGTFNAVLFKAAPTPPAEFAGVSNGLVAGVPRPPGAPFTYINGLLNADPLDFAGGMSWSLLGQVRTPQALEFTGGPLGSNISTAGQPGGRLFLANIHMLQGAASVNVQLVNSSGAQVGPTLSLVTIPEPASFGLVAVGLLGLAALRRRR